MATPTTRQRRVRHIFSETDVKKQTASWPGGLRVGNPRESEKKLGQQMGFHYDAGGGTGRTQYQIKERYIAYLYVSHIDFRCHNMHFH